MELPAAFGQVFFAVRSGVNRDGTIKWGTEPEGGGGNREVGYGTGRRGTNREVGDGTGKWVTEPGSGGRNHKLGKEAEMGNRSCKLGSVDGNQEM